MKSEKSMTFAPGWSQVFNSSTENEEKVDLLIYLSDTHKALHGVRARWFSMDDPIEYLRQAADDMQQEVLDEIEWNKQQAHERMLEANRHALATRKAKKPLPKTHKPFANLKEMLV